MNTTTDPKRKVRPASSFAYHGKYLDADPVEFREKFNRKHFAFSHRLAAHPLFDLQRLCRLSETLPASDIYNADGGSRVDGMFNPERLKKWTPREAIEHIEESGSWCVLKRIEQDTEYKALVDDCFAELVHLSGGGLNDKIIRKEGFIFVTSPGKITPYHIDPQWSVLLQIRGQKSYTMHEADDRENLPEDEIAGLSLGDPNAAKYRPEYASRGVEYDMHPGDATQQPVHAPHSAAVGDQVSISFSIAVITKNVDIHRHAIMVNHVLRKAGFSPTPLGKSAGADRWKFLLGRGLRFIPKAKGLKKLLGK